LTSGTRDTQIAFASKAVVLLVSLGVQSSLAWLLGTDGRGSYAVCLLFATLLGTVLSFGIDSAGQYYVASGKMKKPEAVWSTLAALLVTSAVAMVVGRTLMEFDLAFFAKAPRSSFMLALIVIPFSVIGLGSVMLLIGMGRITWMAITSVATIIVQLVVALVLMMGFGLGVNGALMAILAAGLTSTVMAMVGFARAGALDRAHLQRAHFKDLVTYGLRSYVAKLSAATYFRLGTMILAFFASTAEIGIFAAGSGLVTRILMVPTSIGVALFSRVAADGEGRPETVSQAARVSAILSGACLLALALLGRPIIGLLLSPSFLRVVPLIWIMVPGVFVRAATKLLMSYFMGTDRPGVCSWAIGLGMGVNVAALLVLLPLYGLAGAAWAMTLGYFTSSAILAVSFRAMSGMTVMQTWLPRAEDRAVLRQVVGGVWQRFGRAISRQ
jgi:O-antigen/teichoic acid export membrane protein